MNENQAIHDTAASSGEGDAGYVRGNEQRANREIEDAFAALVQVMNAAGVDTRGISDLYAARARPRSQVGGSEITVQLKKEMKPDYKTITTELRYNIPDSVHPFMLQFERHMEICMLPSTEWVRHLRLCNKMNEATMNALENVVKEVGDNYEEVRNALYQQWGPPDNLYNILGEMGRQNAVEKDQLADKIEQLRAIYNRSLGTRERQLSLESLISFMLCYLPPEQKAQYQQRWRHVKADPSIGDKYHHMLALLPQTFASAASLLEACSIQTAPEEKPVTVAYMEGQSADRNRSSFRGKRGSNEKDRNPKRTKTNNQGPQCKNCGRSCSVVGGERHCGAVNAKCRKCGEIGHYAVRCPKNNNADVDMASIENSRNGAYVTVKLDKRYATTLVDGGAEISFVRPSMANVIEPCNTVRVRLADGSIRRVQHKTILQVTMKDFKASHTFYVFDECIADCILGLDFQAAHDVYARPSRFAVILPNGQTLPFLSRKWKRVLYAAAAQATPESHLSKEVRDREHRSYKLAVIGKHLTDEQRKIVEALLDQRADHFTSPERPLGRSKNFYHRVRPAGPPFKMKLQPLSPAYLAVQKENIDKMRSMGVLVDTQSEYATRPTFAPKKGGEIRFCMNFRKLNKMDTINDNYPIPRSPQLLETFQGMCYFTTLDAASGYWQIPIHPDDRKYTAIICEEGHFEHARMPFGLKNAPATYQRMMDTILKGCRNFTQCFIDDVIIFSRTFEEHVKHVKRVMQVLHEEGLMLRLVKCNFFMPEVEYLGHMVGGGGIRMDEKKLLNIAKFPRPENITAVQRFLGMTGYYRKFIKDYAKISFALSELVKRGKPWEWTEEVQQSFDAVLKAFEQNVVLQHPNYKKKFYVDTDASDAGVGAVLLQKDAEGKLRPIFFASRKLTPGERKWSVREKEALAIVFGVSTFRHHILGTKFEVRSDHQSLQWLMDAKTGRIARWALLLSEYEPFEVKYRSGQTNKVADALSRMYEDSECLSEEVFCGATQVESFAKVLSRRTPTPAELRFAQHRDRFCLRRLTDIESFPNFVIRNGLLGIEVEGRFRPVLPQAMVEDVIKNFHDNPIFAHMGPKRTCSHVSELFVVPGLRKVARRILQSCITCQQRKATRPRHGFLSSKPPQRPFEQVAMDFCGPYKEAADGHRYVLVMIDHFTKYVELVPCKDNRASTVVNAFYREMICRHGVPERLLTDNGSHFRNYMMEALCQVFGCFKAYSSPYYPEGDGQVERFMRNMNDSLAILCDTNLGEWNHYIPGVQFAYNTSIHSVTKLTPFQLVFGRTRRCPFEVDYGAEETDPKRLAPAKYARTLRNVITSVKRRAQENIQTNWIRMAARYNRGRRELRIKVGQYALVRLAPRSIDKDKTMGRKLALRWSEPVRVTEVKSSGKAFDVEHQDGKCEVVNATRLLRLPPVLWEPTRMSFQKTIRDVDRTFNEKKPVEARELTESTTTVRIRVPKALITSELCNDRSSGSGNRVFPEDDINVETARGGDSTLGGENHSGSGYDGGSLGGYDEFNEADPDFDIARSVEVQKRTPDESLGSDHPVPTAQNLYDVVQEELQEMAREGDDDIRPFPMTRRRLSNLLETGSDRAAEICNRFLSSL